MKFQEIGSFGASKLHLMTCDYTFQSEQHIVAGPYGVKDKNRNRQLYSP